MYMRMKRAADLPEMDSANWEAQLRKGSLGLAVLAALWEGRMYGLEMLRKLESAAGLTVPEGTIYPLLSRLKADGLVESEWVESEAGHPRKYYRLTTAGRSYLRDISSIWHDFADGINRLLAPLEKTHAKRKTN
jgi:PadR family transcriptional regulator